jgi:hypothetical protein
MGIKSSVKSRATGELQLHHNNAKPYAQASLQLSLQPVTVYIKRTWAHSGYDHMKFGLQVPILVYQYQYNQTKDGVLDPINPTTGIYSKNLGLPI